VSPAEASAKTNNNKQYPQQGDAGSSGAGVELDELGLGEEQLGGLHEEANYVSFVCKT